MKIYKNIFRNSMDFCTLFFKICRVPSAILKLSSYSRVKNTVVFSIFSFSQGLNKCSYMSLTYLVSFQIRTHVLRFNFERWLWDLEVESYIKNGKIINLLQVKVCDMSKCGMILKIHPIKTIPGAKHVPYFPHSSLFCKTSWSI